MLQSLRNWASGYVAAIFILVIAASFAVWGINDVFINRTSEVVATVGDEEITIEQFQNARENRMRQLQQQFRRRLTDKEAAALGVNQQVLSSLIGAAAISEHAQDLKLGVSDQAIVDDIQSENVFRDTSGRFNNAAFQEALRQRGLTERRFVDNRKQTVMRDQITDAMLSEVPIPTSLVSVLSAYRDETRALEYFSFKPAADLKIDNPTDKELEAFYNANIRDFTAPELRKIGLILLEPTAMAKTVEMSDDDLKREFEASKSRFETPERRRVQRITFKTKEAAEKAKAAIDKGKSFEDAAKDAGFTPEEITLGNVVRERIADAKVRETAFSLEQGKVSDVIETGLGPALVAVPVVEAGKVAEFDKVKDQIKQQLGLRRARRKINDIYNAIQEDLGGGADLKQAAENHGATYQVIEAIDRTGKDATGTDVPAVAGRRPILSAVFGADKGAELDPIDVAPGTYAFAEVLDITASRKKPLKEVRTKAIEQYKETQRNTALAKQARELAEKANKGASLAELAKETNAAVKTVEGIKRSTRNAFLPQAVITQAFSLPLKTAAYAAGKEAGERIIFRVTQKKTPEQGSDAAKKAIIEDLQRGRTTDMLAEYVAGLQQKYNFKLDERAFGMATGAIPYPGGGGSR